MLEKRATLGGQAALGLAYIKSSLEELGEGLIPITRIGPVIISKFFVPLAEHAHIFGEYVNANWKKWIGYIDNVAIPGACAATCPISVQSAKSSAKTSVESTPNLVAR